MTRPRLRPALTTTLLAACAFWGWSSAPAEATSSFQNSCRNINLTFATNNVGITAECRRRSGSWNNTTMWLANIQNINGELQPGGENQSFLRSCTRLHLQWDNSNVRLFAQCRRRDGGSRSTFILIDRLDNIDGTLQFR